MQEDKRLLEYVKKKTEDLDPSKYLPDSSWSNMCSNLQKHETDHMRRRVKNKHRNCKSLQEQVDRLEYEVQNLLLTLHNNVPRSKSQNRLIF